MDKFRTIYVIALDDQVYITDDISDNTENTFSWICIEGKDKLDKIRLKLDNIDVILFPPSIEYDKVKFDDKYKDEVLRLGCGKDDKEKITSFFETGIGLTAMLFYLLPERCELRKKYKELSDLTHLQFPSDMVNDVLKYYIKTKSYLSVVDTCKLFWNAYTLSSLPSLSSPQPQPQQLLTNDDVIKMVIEGDTTSTSSTSSTSSTPSTSSIPPPPPPPLIDERKQLNDFSRHLYEEMRSMYSEQISREVEGLKSNLINNIKNIKSNIERDLEVDRDKTLTEIDNAKITAIGEISKVKTDITNQLITLQNDIVNNISKIKEEPISMNKLMTIETDIIRLKSIINNIGSRLNGMEKILIDLIEDMNKQ
jgi:hypothetical protein